MGCRRPITSRVSSDIFRRLSIAFVLRTIPGHLIPYLSGRVELACKGMRRPQPIHCSHISISAVNLAKFLGRHYNFGMRFEAIEGGRSCQFLGNPATAKSNPKGPPLPSRRAGGSKACSCSCIHISCCVTRNGAKSSATTATFQLDCRSTIYF